jgi:hypothetical protein
MRNLVVFLLLLVAVPAWGQGALPGGGDVVTDTTPQLGGNLDVNENAICDGDGDTCIQLEEGADDDTFRLDLPSLGDAFNWTGDGTNMLWQIKSYPTPTLFQAQGEILNDAGSAICTYMPNGDDGQGSFWCHDPRVADRKQSTLAGWDAGATVAGSTCLGRSSSCAGCIAVGDNPICFGADATIVGDGGLAVTGSSGVGDAVLCGDNGTGLSARGACSGQELDIKMPSGGHGHHVAHGFDQPNSYEGCGSIGGWDRDDTDDCEIDLSFYFGGETEWYTRYVYGQGNTLPGSVDITITGTAGEGTDDAASDIIFEVPPGTGTGLAGDFLFRFAAAGTTGSAENSHALGVEFDGETGLLIPRKVTADPCASGAPEGGIFYNDTSNYMCFCDGTDDVQMHSPATACF